MHTGTSEQSIVDVSTLQPVDSASGGSGSTSSGVEYVGIALAVLGVLVLLAFVGKKQRSKKAKYDSDTSVTSWGSSYSVASHMSGR